MVLPRRAGAIVLPASVAETAAAAVPWRDGRRQLCQHPRLIGARVEDTGIVRVGSESTRPAVDRGSIVARTSMSADVSRGSGRNPDASSWAGANAASDPGHNGARLSPSREEALNHYHPATTTGLEAGIARPFAHHPKHPASRNGARRGISSIVAPSADAVAYVKGLAAARRCRRPLSRTRLLSYFAPAVVGSSSPMLCFANT